MAMSILYRVVDFGKTETPVFHIERTYQKSRFFHQKIGQQFQTKKIEKNDRQNRS